LATAKAATAAGAIEHQCSSPIEALWHPQAERLNGPLADAFAALEAHDFERRTHFIGGRFENLYLPSDRLPGLAELLAFALERAGDLLGISTDQLRLGFWLNAMAPGQGTSRHCHDENDELLSGVYYVTAPRESGAILFHDGPFETRVVPRAGLMLLFPPELPHSVGTNLSQALRLSIAFNIGPSRSLSD
jgi:hypothetical protein